MEGHSLALDHHYLLRLDDLAGGRLDSESTAVQVLYLEVSPDDRVEEGDLFCHQKVGSLPFEVVVLLLGNDKDDIPCLLHGVLVCLTVESVLLAIRSSFVYSNSNDFLLLGNDIFISLFNDSVSIDSYLEALAIVEVFKGALDWVDNRLGFLRA